jgi:hypothetical protein
MATQPCAQFGPTGVKSALLEADASALPLACKSIKSIKNVSWGSERDWSRYVLVLYLERPPDNSAQLYAFRGRFGYSDLKEAAHRGSQTERRRG